MPGRRSIRDSHKRGLQPGQIDYLGLSTRLHGKFKRQGRFEGQRPDWKKAWVRLKAGEKLPTEFKV